jgi:hypothetical protein
VGRWTLLWILVLASPAYGEARLQLAFEQRHTIREEVAVQPAASNVAPLIRIDLSRFAAARSMTFAPIATHEAPELGFIETRDNCPREWLPERDFELAANLDALSIAINHHALDRNWSEAQVTATLTREF